MNLSRKQRCYRSRPFLDALADTENLLNWTRSFGPLSGHEAKIDKPRERYVVAAFCYGCNLGPSQTARSLKDSDRRQIAWVNQRHITEEHLDQAIRGLRLEHEPEAAATGLRLQCPSAFSGCRIERGKDTIRNLKHAKRLRRGLVPGCGAVEIDLDRGWAMFPNGNRR
jgi:hypothetical protein